jgi:hypothetical protein
VAAMVSARSTAATPPDPSLSLSAFRAGMISLPVHLRFCFFNVP